MMIRHLTEQDYIDAAKKLDVELAVIKAVAEVESSGDGFREDGLPKILFEGHYFSRFTGGKYDKDYPTISHPRQTYKYYHLNQYDRLNIAKALDVDSALKSASWGKFQIMGSNHKEAGHDSVGSFVYHMQLSEGEQLKAFITLIKSWNLAGALKRKDWETFARRYNGAGYWKQGYHLKLEKAYNKHKRNQ
jgi:hypothetical protein